MFIEKENRVLSELVGAFRNADFDPIVELVQKGLDSGLSPEDILNEGLIVGIREVGDQFKRGEIFLPEMMLSAQAWQSGMKILEPLMVKQSSQAKGTVVIGTVKGDIHNLGKNIVINLLKTDGFSVVDLGVDVPASAFIAKSAEHSADIIAVCALMTTTLPQQKEVIEHLIAAGKRKDYFVMIGGASTTQEWAKKIEADAYGETAWDAVTLANEYIKRRKEN